jgi:hypothetical protein
MAISFLSFDDFILTPNQMGSFCFIGLGDDKDFRTAKRITKWIALSLRSTKRIRGKLVPNKESGQRCRGKDSFRIEALAEAEAEAQVQGVFLFPVMNYYSFYIDVYGTLRRFDHHNRQNQPLVYKFGSVEFFENHRAHAPSKLIAVRQDSKMPIIRRKINFKVPFREKLHPSDLFILLSRIVK